MNSLSYMIDASSLTRSDLELIEDSLESLEKNKQSLEINLYSVNPSLQSYTPRTNLLKLSTLSGSKNNSLRDSVASTSGDLLVFTTLSVILQSRHVINDILSNVPLFAGIAGTHQKSSSTFSIGYREISNSPFVAFNKIFFIDNIGYSRTLKYLLKLAEKQLLLDIIPINDSDFPRNSYILTKLKIPKPYHIIASRNIQKLRKHIDTQINERKKRKLRQKVKPVVYSKDIPIFIISRDRVEPLKQLIKWLEEEGTTNIYIIDNASTYTPLVEYLKKTPYKVFFLNKNAGHTSPWSEGIIKLYAYDTPFIVTDPDVIPDNGSHGAIKLFYDLLNKYPERTKVGFGLKIDDLPDHYEQKNHVITWESQFWESKVEPDVYDAEIDTTFALYRENTPYVHGPGLRTGGKFAARHEPWYVDSKHPSEEIIYYRNHASKEVGTWGITERDISRVYEKSRRAGR